MKNWQRWLLSFGIGAFGGVVGVASASGVHTWPDYGKAALIGMAPTALALKMTLDKLNP